MKIFLKISCLQNKQFRLHSFRTSGSDFCFVLLKTKQKTFKMVLTVDVWDNATISVHIQDCRRFCRWLACRKCVDGWMFGNLVAYRLNRTLSQTFWLLFLMDWRGSLVPCLFLARYSPFCLDLYVPAISKVFVLMTKL